MHRGKRVRVRELNPNLICVLCSGYFIDATTLTECLHSFCKTCIVKYLESSKNCPVCDVVVHKTKPHLHIRSDKTLQDLVYKLIPGMFKTEMKRRRDFYSENPESLPEKVGEERGDENAERILYTEDEKFSVSLHFCSQGVQDEPLVRTLTLPEVGAAAKEPVKRIRYLQCPAGVTVDILKKFVRYKYDLPGYFLVDIFHSDESLRDEYTLMDVAYIYTWRRKEPLKLNFSVYEFIVKRRKMSCPKNVRLLDLNNLMKPDKTGNNDHQHKSAGPKTERLQEKTADCKLAPSKTGCKDMDCSEDHKQAVVKVEKAGSGSIAENKPEHCKDDQRSEDSICKTENKSMDCKAEHKLEDCNTTAVPNSKDDLELSGIKNEDSPTQHISDKVEQSYLGNPAEKVQMCKKYVGDKPKDKATVDKEGKDTRKTENGDRDTPSQTGQVSSETHLASSSSKAGQSAKKVSVADQEAKTEKMARTKVTNSETKKIDSVGCQPKSESCHVKPSQSTPIQTVQSSMFHAAPKDQCTNVKKASKRAASPSSRVSDASPTKKKICLNSSQIPLSSVNIQHRNKAACGEPLASQVFEAKAVPVNTTLDSTETLTHHKGSSGKIIGSLKASNMNGAQLGSSQNASSPHHSKTTCSPEVKTQTVPQSTKPQLHAISDQTQVQVVLHDIAMTQMSGTTTNKGQTSEQEKGLPCKNTQEVKLVGTMSAGIQTDIVPALTGGAENTRRKSQTSVPVLSVSSPVPSTSVAYSVGRLMDSTFTKNAARPVPSPKTLPVPSSAGNAVPCAAAAAGAASPASAALAASSSPSPPMASSAASVKDVVDPAFKRVSTSVGPAAVPTTTACPGQTVSSASLQPVATPSSLQSIGISVSSCLTANDLTAMHKTVTGDIPNLGQPNTTTVTNAATFNLGSSMSQNYLLVQPAVVPTSHAQTASSLQGHKLLMLPVGLPSQPAPSESARHTPTNLTPLCSTTRSLQCVQTSLPISTPSVLNNLNNPVSSALQPSACSDDNSVQTEDKKPVSTPDVIRAETPVLSMESNESVSKAVTLSVNLPTSDSHTQITNVNKLLAIPPKVVTGSNAASDVNKPGHNATQNVLSAHRLPTAGPTKGLFSSRNGMPTVVARPARVNNVSTSVNTLSHRLPVTSGTVGTLPHKLSVSSGAVSTSYGLPITCASINAFPTSLPVSVTPTVKSSGFKNPSLLFTGVDIASVQSSPATSICTQAPTVTSSAMNTCTSVTSFSPTQKSLNTMVNTLDASHDSSSTPCVHSSSPSVVTGLGQLVSTTTSDSCQDETNAKTPSTSAMSLLTMSSSVSAPVCAVNSVPCSVSLAKSLTSASSATCSVSSAVSVAKSVSSSLNVKKSLQSTANTAVPISSAATCVAQCITSSNPTQSVNTVISGDKTVSSSSISTAKLITPSVSLPKSVPSIVSMSKFVPSSVNVVKPIPASGSMPKSVSSVFNKAKSVPASSGTSQCAPSSHSIARSASSAVGGMKSVPSSVGMANAVSPSVTKSLQSSVDMTKQMPTSSSASKLPTNLLLDTFPRVPYGFFYANTAIPSPAASPGFALGDGKTGTSNSVNLKPSKGFDNVPVTCVPSTNFALSSSKTVGLFSGQTTKGSSQGHAVSGHVNKGSSSAASRRSNHQALQSGNQTVNKPLPSTKLPSSSSSAQSTGRPTGSATPISSLSTPRPKSSATPMPIQPVLVPSSEGVGLAGCSPIAVAMAARRAQMVLAQAKQHQLIELQQLQLLQQQQILSMRAVAALAAGYNPLQTPALLSGNPLQIGGVLGSHMSLPQGPASDNVKKSSVDGSKKTPVADGAKKPMFDSTKKSAQPVPVSKKSDPSPKKKISDIANSLHKKISQTLGSASSQQATSSSSNAVDKRPPFAHSSTMSGTTPSVSISLPSTSSSKGDEDQPLNLVMTRPNPSSPANQAACGAATKKIEDKH